MEFQLGKIHSLPGENWPRAQGKVSNETENSKNGARQADSAGWAKSPGGRKALSRQIAQEGQIAPGRSIKASFDKALKKENVTDTLVKGKNKIKKFIVFQYLIIIFAENITIINNQQKPELLAQLL